MKPLLSLVTAALTALLCGCVGTHFNFDQVRRVRVGMTEREVTNIMGKPNTITAAGGQVRWVYAFGTALGTGKAASFVFRDGQVVEVPAVPTSFK